MDGGDVCAYLDANRIETEITAAVAACVEQVANPNHGLWLRA